MPDSPLELKAGEHLRIEQDAQIVPEGSAPQPGHIWITNLRIVARWTGGGGLFHTVKQSEMELSWAEVREIRLPGGPLVQVIPQDGPRLSVQTFEPLKLRQLLEETARVALAINEHSAQLDTGGEQVEAGDGGGVDAQLDGEQTVCTKCGGMNERSARYCALCGTKLRPKEGFCKRCSIDYPGYYRFCPACGDQLDVGGARGPVPNSKRVG